MANQKEVTIDPVSKPFNGPLTNAIVSISHQKCVYKKTSVLISIGKAWSMLLSHEICAFFVCLFV